MKILFVNKLYAPDAAGGAEVVLEVLARGQQARGHDITVVTTTAGDRVVEETVDGIRVIRLPLRNIYWHNSNVRQSAAKRFVWHALDIYNRAMGESLGEVIRSVDPDVVCCHNLSGFSVSAWDAATRAGKPTVQVLHDYYHLCPRSQLFRDGKNCERPCAECRVFRIGRAQAANKVQAVLGVSHAVLDAHLERGLFTRVPLRTVVNNALVAQVRAPRSYAETARVFGFIGTLGEWKGISRLLAAFQRLAADRACPRLRLLVAGAGEQSYVAELKRTFAAEGIEFLGRVTPEAFFAQVDALVVPSLWRDPLPTVIAEAFLFGVPVVGAKRGGMPEMIEHEANGLLYDPDVEGELESSVRRLAQTPLLLARLGAGARVSAKRFADMERMLDEHIATYRAAMDAKP